VVTAPVSGDYTVRVNSLPIGGDTLGDYSVRAVVLDGH